MRAPKNWLGLGPRSSKASVTSDDDTRRYVRDRIMRRFMVLMHIDGQTFCLSMHRTKASAETRVRQHRRYVYPVGRYSFTVKELGV